MLRNPEHFFPTGGYLLGDSAYPLSRHLIVPYPNSEAMANPHKRRFNRMLSSSRVSIERAFGLLVARWRILGFHLYVLGQMDINDIISACCILHTICIDRGEIQFPIQPDLLEFMQPLDNAESATGGRAARIERDNLLVKYFGEEALW